MGDEVFPEQLIPDDHQNGLCNHHNEEEGRQDGGSIVHLRGIKWYKGAAESHTIHHKNLIATPCN